MSFPEKEEIDDRNGMIFNIQRYSLHDGAGIRTTVFFKGCPLKCLWCANPESHKSRPQILFNADICGHCGICVKGCKNGAKTQEGFRPDLCRMCLECVKACPTAAMELSGKKMTVDEVMRELLRDMVFFQNSGGGITFSGGEVLMQWQFASALAERIKAAGLPLAVETSGYAKWENAENLFRHCDELLFDIKHMDDTMHIKYMGVSNALILENAVKASKIAKHFIVRIPLIGGVNDDDENILATAGFMKKNGMKEMHFLPYHRYGEKKYEKLGVAYDFKAYTPSGEQMERLKEVVSGYDLSVHIGG
ncbi:glycyl-radical enzyme activating protein [Spirochaetia bacterium]|nr:glycyl-radical enzyme activating protein [Spirochaetia bacterium]